MKKRTILFATIFLSLSLFITMFFLPAPQNPRLPGNSKALKQYFFEKKKEKHLVEKKDHPGEAMEYLVMLRSEVGKSFSYSGSWRFDAYREAMQQAALHKNAKTYSWTERGPANVGGRTRSIVVHPTDANKWWVAAVGGGIWFTANAGESWTNQTDELPAISTTTLALCTSSPDVIYAGTGEGFYNGDALVGDGIMKTIDGGANWTQLSSTAGELNFRWVNRMIVHPQNPDTVLAATNTGVFRSVDGGQNWSMTFSGRVQQIIYNPLNFSIQYMTYHSFGIYKSTDGGQNWTWVSEEFSPDGRIEIAISHSDPNILYAALTGYNDTGSKPVSSGLQGFYRSADAGETWTLLGNAPNWLGNQGWYDSAVAVSPDDPDIVIAGGLDLYKVRVNSTNNTMVGIKTSHWYGGEGLPYVHADQHFIYTMANTEGSFSIIAANDGGIHFSPDGGVNWIEKNNGYNVTQFYDGDRSPIQEQFIGGTQDNGTQLSPQTAGITSEWDEVIGGDGFDCAWDKYNPRTLYGSLYYTDIRKSTDGGATFNGIGNGIGESNLFHTPIALNPFDSENLATAADNDLLYLTYNGGENWLARNVDFSGSGNIKIAFSESNEDIIWAGSTNNTLYVSTDKGQTFNIVNSPSGIGSLYLTGIATSTLSDSTAYLSFGVSSYPKIFRTTDMGQSWENLTGDLPNVPVNAVLEMPYNTNEIWSGTDIGLFITTNGGTTWTFANDNLPSVAIFRLKIHGKEILAVTHGRGMFTTVNDSLPDFALTNAPPQLEELYYGDPSKREVLIDFFNRSSVDSMHLLVNDSVIKTYGTTDQFQYFTESYIPVANELSVKTKIIGFSGGAMLASNMDSLTLLNMPSANYKIDFSDTSDILSDDFSITQPANFNSSALHSPHPYFEAHDFIAVLKTPVSVTSSSGIYYRDVVIVEKGEPGIFYPAQEMWDYVTVEGSKDGKNWDILIDPYDSRANGTWESTYDAGGSGTEAMMVNHKIDLSAVYNDGDIVVVRFRLLSDPAVTGWGWAIDDVEVTDKYVGIDDESSNLATTFSLYGNYPNPFNPGTTIRFTVPANQEASLVIYNTLGQKVRTLFKDRRFSGVATQGIYWDGRNDAGQGVASGVYIYRLSNPGRSLANQMLLLK